MDLAAQMQDPEFWRRFAPNMNTAGLAIGPRFEIPEANLDVVQREINTVGYSQIDSVFPIDEIAEVHRAIKAMREIGLLPLYAFAFDETWGLFLRMSTVWKKILGDDWVFIPALWGWWVEPGALNAGWPAHRDRGKQNSLHPDGSPMSLTAWIPLTRATPANGCMYVLPTGLDFDKLTLKTIQNARAMPAAPGSILLWNQAVWHWSGTSSRRAPNPRVSISVEMQTSKVKPFQNRILDPLMMPPPLNQRLALIGQQVLQYLHFTKLEGEPVKLAEELQRYA